MPESRIFKISTEDAGRRVDLFIAAAIPSLTRSHIQRLVEGGMVKVNGKPPRSSHKVREGEKVEVLVPDPEPAVAIPEEIPLDVVYEDSDLIVVNKPSGLVVHPAAGNPSGTLVNALLHHCTDLSGIGGTLRPGIVHRLDKDTTGLLVVAKSDAAHRSLGEQFKKHSIKRRYLALVHGVIKEDKGKIEAEIGRDLTHRKKMSIRTKRGRIAVTHFKVMERFNRFTLLELMLETGRTHQIRVHLSSIRHPVVGDQVYGGKERIGEIIDTKLRKAIRLFGRQALHAETLGFIHPASGRFLEFHTPLPEDMNNLLELCRGGR